MEPQFLPESIEGDRTVLRKHRLELAQQMFEYVDRDRARLGRFLPWVPHIESPADEEAFIQLTLEDWETKSKFGYGIFRSEDGEYLGNIGVFSLRWRHAACEIGYWILGEFEGRGYVRDAVLALEQALFGMGFHRIVIRCDVLNERSANLPRRNGYHLDGTMREDSFTGDGYRDTLVFSKLRTDA